MSEDDGLKAMGQVIQIDEARIRDHLGEMVRGTVEETLNGLLDAEADRLCGAGRYERTQGRQDTRAGSYERSLHTVAYSATIRMRTRIASPKLLPKTGPLPHLICSRQSNLGSGDEEGEHGDTSGIDFGDQGALRLGRAAGKGKDSG